MDPYSLLPNRDIVPAGIISKTFLDLKVKSFKLACEYVHHLPYGYNTNRDDMMSLFEESKGSCTTKHAVIATLASELELPVEKQIGIYAMTEALATGTDAILKKFTLPYLPMVHCFLASGIHRVDLTEGNLNGKNGPIDAFLLTVPVEPNISAKDEYLLYRRALTKHILIRNELKSIALKTVLQAREEGLVLLKAKIK